MATTTHQPNHNLTFEPLEASKPPATTTTEEFVPSGDVDAKLFFYQGTNDGERPYNYVEEPPAGVPRSNLDIAEIDVTVHDIRSHPEFVPNLNDNAFQFGSEKTSLKYDDFASDEIVEKQYYAEIKDIVLRNVPGAKDVTIFDHTIRRANPGAKRAPVNRVHIDQTRSSGPQRVHFHHPNEAETLLQDRVRIINVWRALNPPIVDQPLAYADAATVDRDDLVGVRHIYPNREGETAGVKYNKGQKWWYKSGFDEQDIVLLQCFDNQGKGSSVPHTAFKHPLEREGRKGRESIEVRCLVWG